MQNKFGSRQNMVVTASQHSEDLDFFSSFYHFYLHTCPFVVAKSLLNIHMSSRSLREEGTKEVILA